VGSMVWTDGYLMAEWGRLLRLMAMEKGWSGRK
jgi:hypothetical protein